MAEALADEPGLMVEAVTLEPGTEGGGYLTAALAWNGEALSVTVEVE